MPATIRAFIAIELDQELKSALVRLGQELQDKIAPRTVRWVKPAAMHLTLRFLGDTPVTKLGAIEKAMSAAASGVPPISFAATSLGSFPSTRRPRVVWVGLDEPAGHLKRLKAALDRELRPLGFEPERRSFSPHLTLGRVHKSATRSQAQVLGSIVDATAVTDVGQMTAHQVHLIRSDLRPAGPVYTILATAPLGGGTAGAGE